MAIPFAARIARFNTHVTNRILGPISWYLPSFGRVEHVGRTSGRRYRTPMMAFLSADRRRLMFALTYGPGAHWVLNALAAGEVTFDSRRDGPRRLVGLHVVHDPRRRAMPWIVRQVLAVMHVDDFLEGTVAVG